LTIDRSCPANGASRIIIVIKDRLNIPVKFVGLGEKPEDIAEFDPDKFVEAMFD